MVSNISNNDKTIKTMFTDLDSDNYTIDKILLYCNYNNENLVSFENILDNYRDYFDQYLVEVELPKRFYYQPAAFAENYYGTPDLDFLVLYFAKMLSMFEFKTEKIKVLPKSRLLEINKLFVEYKTIVTESYKHPTGFIEEN